MQRTRVKGSRSERKKNKTKKMANIAHFFRVDIKLKKGRSWVRFGYGCQLKAKLFPTLFLVCLKRGINACM